MEGLVRRPRPRPGQVRAPEGTVLVDTHVHLDDEAYAGDWRECLDRAGDAGVAAVVVPGSDLDSSCRIARMAAQDPRVLPGAGIHPHQAAGFSARSAERLRELARGAVALGETGLDFHYGFSPRGKQIENLRSHLELARELCLPLILHCREAERELCDELERRAPFPAGGVVHCFTGGWEWGKRFLELGFYLGVTGMVTYPRLVQVHEVARHCPRDRLLVETDGPYLAPAPFRGRRNEPCHVAIVARRVAELRGEPLEQVARATTAAARALFGKGVPASPPLW